MSVEPAQRTDPETVQPCCDYRDHNSPCGCDCPEHPIGAMHPNGWPATPTSTPDWQDLWRIDVKVREGEADLLERAEQIQVAPKLRDGDQPLPVVNENPAIQTLVVADIEARTQVGIHRYGTPLQANNGRDALRDLYEELLDAANYTRQLIFERDGK